MRAGSARDKSRARPFAGVSLLAWLALVLMSALRPASAHEIRPAYIEIREQANQHIHVLWKQPAVGAVAVALAPRVSAGWLDAAPDSRVDTATWLIREWDIAPPHAALSGQTLQIEGLDHTITDVMARIEYANGISSTAIIHPDHPWLELQAPVHASVPVMQYLELGFTHIWEGVDLLLYVLGLMLLVDGLRALVKTITAFTLAHSVTLAAAALGWVHVPQAPVEAVIALSIVYVAVELVHLRQGRPGLARHYPWLVAFSFGLLHGLGFAGALAEIGLPEHEIPQALLLFNLGIEFGQLSFVASVLALGGCLQRLLPRALPRVAAIPPYLIGGLASFWMIERMLACF